MKDTKWVTMWGNAMSISNHTAQEYSRNITLRYPIFAPFSGSKLRLTFDNFCGTENSIISSVVVGSCHPDNRKEVLKETMKQVTFDGNSYSAVISPGARVTSDPIPFSVEKGQMISVTFYLGHFTQMRSSVVVTGPLSGGQFSMGDQTKTGIFSRKTSRNTNSYYFLSDVEILTQEENHAVVCYGDSITAQDWPDDLMLLLAKEEDNHTAVVRKAASGTRILRQYDCITYESYGLKGDVRFPHELPVTGADTIIIQQGINDIIHPVGRNVNIFRPMSDLPTLEELKEGFSWYLEEAKKLGLVTLTGTLLPIKGWRTYAPFREEMKNGFNDWIRGNQEADGCIDFDKAVRDQKDPAAFQEGFDSGDHLHPSGEAYLRMAKEAKSELEALKNRDEEE